MGNIEDLDEFDAELELSLKREYSTVFPLFTYCVLTQEATYLCNKLEVNFVPQTAYPFFDISMEDVWVWDKNRPTRIIPKAQIYTASDVTIEQLRTDSGEDLDSSIPDDVIEQLRNAPPVEDVESSGDDDADDD